MTGNLIEKTAGARGVIEDPDTFFSDEFAAALNSVPQLKIFTDPQNASPDQLAALQDAVGITPLLERIVALENAQVKPPAPTLSLSSAVTKVEGDTGSVAFVWTLTLNRDGSNASFPYAWTVGAIGANPANVADFGGAFPTGDGTFGAGETSKQISVPVTGDTAVEPAETFSLTVTGVSLNTVTSTGTISNDDALAIPTLTLAGPMSYFTNTAAGTTVANIGSVPAGATPTISPNDGRLAVAGNATDGWRVVVGLSASSAGTIALTVSANGANSATADVTVAAAGDKLSRMTVTQAGDTGNSSALVTALAANNARPTYALAANTPRTVFWKIGAVANPGAFIAYIVDQSGYTAVAEQSFDSTNGVDGAWSRLTDALVFPAGGTSSQGAENTRQIAAIPGGAARYVRLTLTSPVAANVYYPAVYQRPATGTADVWLGTGPSLEGYGMWSKEMEDAIIAAYPTRDPIFLRYANGGTTVSTVKNYPAQIAASHWADLFSYVMIGSALGNDVTDRRPISDDTTASIAQLTADYTTLLTGFPGRMVFPCRTTYRAYSEVSVTNQEGGSLGYNKQIVDPGVAANVAAAYDSALQIPRVDLYSAAMLNRGALKTGDPTHFANYVWYRAEWIRTAVRFAYTGTWPTPFIETLVAKAESTKLPADINEAQYAVNSLVASSAKTALQNRITAATNNPAMAFAVPAMTLAENAGTFANVINVDRSTVTSDIVINLAYTGTATSGADYVAGPATVTLPAGSGAGSVSFDLTINDDASQESSEAIIVTATLAAYPSVTATKTITVNDNDGAGGITYSQEATDYFAAMTTQLNDTQKSQVDAFLIGLKNDGILPKVGALPLYFLPDPQAAMLNSVNPSKSYTMAGGITHSARGVKGGGSGHVNFGEGYGASGHALRDNFTLFAWCNETGTETGTSPHMGKTSNASPSVRLSGFGTAGSNETYNLNDGTNSSQRQSTGGRLGFRMVVRNGNSKIPHFNGVKGNVSTVASTGDFTGIAAALRNDTTYSTDGLAFSGWAAGFSDAEAAAFYNRANVLLTAFGAA